MAGNLSGSSFLMKRLSPSPLSSTSPMRRRTFDLGLLCLLSHLGSPRAAACRALEDSSHVATQSRSPPRHFSILKYWSTSSLILPPSQVASWSKKLAFCRTSRSSFSLIQPGRHHLRSLSVLMYKLSRHQSLRRSC